METIDIQIKSNVPEVTKETTSLRQQMKDLRKEMEACTVGSEEYAAALQKLANVTHDFKDQQEEIRNSAGDLGTVFDNLQNVSSNVAAGFSAVNAVTTLFGANSENLQKVMVKLQAGMALVQGMKGMEGMGKDMKHLITSIGAMITSTKSQDAANKKLASSQTLLSTTTKGASKAMKGFRTALISTGIGAIVVAVGLLINGLSKLIDIIGTAVNKDSEFKGVNESLNATFEEQNRVQDNEIKIMQASGATTEQIIQKKIDLQKAQIAETLATIENIKARNKQIEKDKKWWKIFSNINRNKQLEQNKEEIEALEEMVTQSTHNLESLQADYTAAVKTTERKNKEEREKAAEKAKELAKKIAEDEKKALQDVEKNAKDTFKKVFEAYVELLNDIKNVQSAVSGDYDAWSTVFGTDPKKIEQKLLGTYKGVIAYATEEAAKTFNENIAALDEDKIKENLAKRFGKTFGEVTEKELVTEFNKIQKEIAEEYYNTLKELGHNLEPFDKLFKFDTTKIDRLVAYIPEQVANAYDDAGRNISATFTNQFNSLERLLNDGIIDYGDYYETLQKMQKKYTEEYKANLEEGKAALKKALDDKKISQEEYNNRVTQLEYEMRLKPKEFQERVNEAILSGYRKNSEEALNVLQKAIDEADAKLAVFESGYITWWDRVSTPIWKYYKEQKNTLKDIEDAEKKAYENRLGEIDKLLNSDSISEEQRKILEDERKNLEDEYTRIKEEGVAKRKALQQAEFDYTIDSLNQTFSAMEGLFSGLNNLSKARMEVLDNQLAEEKITKKEYDKLKKQEIEKQAAMQKGVAIMQTAAGITSALATAMQLGFPVGPIVGAITAAALGVSLAAQLKSINAAKEAALRGNDSATTSTPDTTFTLTSPDAYQNTLSDEVQTDLQANAKDNQRVYVVSSDISNAQNNEKTTVTTATF